MRHVVLCTENGTPTGTMDIASAHSAKGLLHRAFSVFVFRSDRKELLIQRRNGEKLFGNLWANTCCSHLQKGENVTEAAQERLQEECGFSCPLRIVASFVYRAPDPKGRGAEYEYDTILVGDLTGPNPNLNPNPEEVAELKWISIQALTKEMAKHPHAYAPWFLIALHAILRNPDAQ
ncbi:isopentenyl-diphosphate delta-isomerase [Candidatus Peregrinibacteria bacterium CG10_big_fil_rev_8_21_14_0_10_55_24]|nr:MAG: isopentenyl-diphosphate delta-isomerase [Candidatus Peregrinibacteria bacterium CG10_big_fil_rev_8_21_14_0_10_55_24]